MKHFLPLALLLLGLGGTRPAQAQTTTSKPTGQVFKKKLPDDLPQSKILFIKQPLVKLPAERPKDMPRLYFNGMTRHNEAAQEANKQLLDAAKDYPFEYRITTLDSVDYYRALGYKYKLYNSSFTAVIDGTYRGTTTHGMGANQTRTTTSVDLYVQDLATNDKYIFDSFSETFVYYYKGQMGMLTKKVFKQFGKKK